MTNDTYGILNEEKIVLLQTKADKILKSAAKRLDLEARTISEDLGEYIIHSEKKLNFHPDVPIVPLQDGEFGYFTKSSDTKRERASRLRVNLGKIPSNYDAPVVPSEDGEHKYFGKN